MEAEVQNGKVLYNRASTMIIFLQGQDEHGVYGQIGNGYLAERVAFHGTGDLILKLDKICDWIGSPHRVADPRMMNIKMMREFQQHQEEHPEVSQNNLYVNMNLDAYMESVSAVEVLVVCVEFRQNASMQGWVTGKLTNDQSVSFRSALELMRMFDEIHL